jgi:transposase
MRDLVRMRALAKRDLRRARQQLQSFLLRYGLSYSEALQALRGISVVNAATLVAEIGCFGRFDHPRQLMAYLGLVPSEHSSGQTIRRGPITKSGNPLARTCLVPP